MDKVAMYKEMIYKEAGVKDLSRGVPEKLKSSIGVVTGDTVKAAKKRRFDKGVEYMQDNMRNYRRLGAECDVLDRKIGRALINRDKGIADIKAVGRRKLGK